MTYVGRLATTLGAIALLQTASAAPAVAQTAAGVVAALGDVQNAMIQASLETYRGQSEQALVTLDQALATLGDVRGSLTDPALTKALARKIKAAEAKAGKAHRSVEDGQRITVQLKRLRVAAKAVSKAALAAGRPVAGEMDTGFAGFHYPGDEVRLQIYAADGSVCTEAPIVEVVNDSFGSAVDLDSVVVDQAMGVVSITMGPDQGVAHVTITACGQTTTVLLYNYGPKAPKGLPKDFPINLPLGTYEMIVSGEIAGASFPPTSVGTFTFVELESFADEITGVLRQVARAASGLPNCDSGVRYSGFDGSGFSITLRLHCSLAGYSVGGHLTCRVDRI